MMNETHEKAVAASIQSSVADSLHLIAMGRLKGRRAAKILRRALAEVVGSESFTSIQGITAHPAYLANMAKARKRAQRDAKGWDRVGYTGLQLLFDLQAITIASHRMRMYGELYTKQDFDNHNNKILWHVSLLEIFTARLLGIPCGGGEDILETRSLSPQLHCSISNSSV